MKVIINKIEELRPLLMPKTNITFGMDPEAFLLEFGFDTSFSGNISLIGNNIYRFNVDEITRSGGASLLRSLNPNNSKDRVLLENALQKDYGIKDYILVKE